MERASFALVGCLVSMLGCFPDPPAVGEVQDGAGDSAEGEADTSGEDAAVETATSADSSIADAVDQEVEISAETSIEDTAGEAEVSVDTSIADTAGEVEVSVDTEVVDTADEEAEVSVDTSIADTASEVEVVEPECEGDEGCSHLVGVCRAGVCQGGVCVEEALTGESCDDDDLCTEGDVCDGGACVGVAVVCEALDDCHDAGECDSRTGECSDVPLSGIGCDDGDACTTGDGCAEGVCAGEAIVCVAKDQCHDAGVCDPQSGQCTEPRKPDTTPCDDGMLCTEEDRCEQGGCVGVEVVCEAIDDCHEVGVCDPGSGVCSTPARPNGSDCDDGDFCSVVDACSQGACFGSGSPDDSGGDFLYVLQSDGDVEIHALAVEPDGSVIAIGKIEGTTMSITAPWGMVTSYQTFPETSCELIRIDFRSDGQIYIGRLGGGASCPSDSTITASLGLIRMLDGSYLTGGVYSVDSFDMTGRNRHLGTSPSGVLHDFGMWVGRMSSFNRFAWAVDLVGAGFELEIPPRTLTASPLGRFWLAMPAQTNNVVEVVYDDSDAEIIATGNLGAAEGIVVEFDAGGRRVGHSTLRCGGGAECTVLPMAMARSADDRLYLGGTVFGGDIEVESAGGGLGLSIPTGVGGDFEGWLVAYDPTGQPAWARHFMPDATTGAYAAYVVALVAEGDGLLGAVASSHYVRTRLGNGAFEYLAPSELGEPLVDEFRGYWFEMGETGTVRAADHLRPTGAVAWSMASDGARRVVAGVVDGRANPSGTLGDDFDNPFVAQIAGWETLVAQPSTTLADVTGDVDGAAPVAVVVSPHGVTMAAAITETCNVGAGGHTVAVDLPEGSDAAVVWRLNSARGLECQ